MGSKQVKRSDIEAAARWYAYRDRLKKEYKAVSTEATSLLKVEIDHIPMALRYQEAARKCILKELGIEIAEVEADLKKLGVPLDDKT